MHCSRCGGWMLSEWLTDLLDDTGHRYCRGWRCVNCGAIDDAVVRRHQANPPGHPYRGRAKSKRRWTRVAIA